MLTRALSYLALGVAGLIVATVGTGAHRALDGIGVAVALVLVALVGVFAKVWMSWWGFIVYAAVWVMMLLVYRDEPGGSQLILDDGYGAAWVYGGQVVLGVVAVIPRFVWVGRDVPA